LSTHTGQEVPEEIAVFKNLKHENIVRYVEHFKGDKQWVIVMEYLFGYQDLYEYLQRKNKNFDELRVASIVSQTLAAVKYLRQRGLLNLLNL
jgi:serine/threonine protein kinase